MAETARIAIVSAAEDAGWRDAASAALSEFAQTRVALVPASVLDPGYPVLLVWTARAAERARVVRKLVGLRADVIVWRPDDTPAPAWLGRAWPVGPDMSAKTLALVARRVQAETMRAVSAPSRKRQAFAAAPAIFGLTMALAVAAAALATQWRERSAVAAEPTPLLDLRGRE